MSLEQQQTGRFTAGSTARPARSRRSVLIVTATVALSAAAVAAVADPWGTATTSAGPRPDSDPHSYCFERVSDRRLIGRYVDDVAWKVLDPSQVNINRHSTCRTDGTSETDVVWQVMDLPGGIRGQAWCQDLVAGQCDQTYADLDLAELRMGDADDADIRKTVCHEFGHTLGLSHGGGADCMLSGERPLPTQSRHESYNRHHWRHIKAWF